MCEQKKQKIPDGAACGNCRFCDFSDGSGEKWCSRIQHHTVPDALCRDWKLRYQTVFEFQEAFPTAESREEKLKEMTDEEIDVLIASCGTIQGKIWYARHKKERKGEGK